MKDREKTRMNSGRRKESPFCLCLTRQISIPVQLLCSRFLTSSENDGRKGSESGGGEGERRSEVEAGVSSGTIGKTMD